MASVWYRPTGRSLFYLLFLDTFSDLSCGVLVSSEQANNTGIVRVQDISINISYYQIQLQNPAQKIKNIRESAKLSHKSKIDLIDSKNGLGKGLSVLYY